MESLPKVNVNLDPRGLDKSVSVSFVVTLRASEAPPNWADAIEIDLKREVYLRFGAGHSVRRIDGTWDEELKPSSEKKAVLIDKHSKALRQILDDLQAGLYTTQDLEPYWSALRGLLWKDSTHWHRMDDGEGLL